MNVVCVAVDGLQAAYLGTYGNSWVGTRHLDALAAQGFVFDQAFNSCPTLAGFYRGAWFARPAATQALDTAPPPAPSLPALLGKAGFHTLLVADDADVLKLAGAADFAAQIAVGPAAETSQAEASQADTPTLESSTVSAVEASAAESDEATATANTIAAAIDAFQQAAAFKLEGTESDTPEPRATESGTPTTGTSPPHQLLWIHLQGLIGPWDAPYARREQYADEDDPAPPDFVAPPHRVLATDADPDEQLGIRQAYAAQVASLDGLLGTLQSLIDASPEPALLCLIGCRGYPLGVHNRIGFPTGESPLLYGDTVQLPWIMRFAGGMHAGGRTAALVEPADLPATLLEACSELKGLTQPITTPPTWTPSLLPVVRGDVEATRDRLLLAAPGETAIHKLGLRTAAWYLLEPAREPATEHSAAPGGPPAALIEAWELYAKPDDRWEINEVAARLPEIAEQMSALLQEQRRVLAGEPVEATPLDEALGNIQR